MKLGLILTISGLCWFFFVLTSDIHHVSAQQSISSQATPNPSPLTPELEQRIYRLEVTQTQNIELLRSSNDYNQFLIQVVGGLIALLVAIQGFATVSQARREKERDDRRARRDEERDRADRTGVEQVARIMNVVQQTLASRLDAEKQAREEAAKAHQQLEEVLKHIAALEDFYNNFQSAILRARQAIEDSASRWAREVSRHDFKRMTIELNDFAQQFDKFKTEFEGLEKEPRPLFTARVPYIRGIAAHYANRPEIAKQSLTEIITFQQPESGESEIAFKRRMANAYYYLGVTESNFGNHQDAIQSFENANSLDLQGKDFLTRIVTAEAYIMINELDKARKYLNEVEERLSALERQQGRLANFHLRLQSRAALIRANIAILGRETNWQEDVKDILRPVYYKDTQYYFITATLGQVFADQAEHEEAEKFFREAYEVIERSGDLLTVTEARSKILLLMVAGMCCKHGLMAEKRSEEYLDRADGLRDSLPKIGPQVCTTFSNLSKRNEHTETIHYHIELIRKGNFFINPNRE